MEREVNIGRNAIIILSKADLRAGLRKAPRLRGHRTENKIPSDAFRGKPSQVLKNSFFSLVPRPSGGKRQLQKFDGGGGGGGSSNRF